MWSEFRVASAVILRNPTQLLFSRTFEMCGTTTNPCLGNPGTELTASRGRDHRERRGQMGDPRRGCKDFVEKSIMRDSCFLLRIGSGHEIAVSRRQK